ncbi:PEP-CTERM sorting domain-containing protein [Botrimarina mediterranea]|uniref:PEP-CTERM sorting domain-containing protein n=1 Tax=Botrimarina mediterranea TaxID=2528022 RepID=UPI0011890054|nr:hypothetical protein K2D_05710 [Planctomycetes bacterium K2D]
MRWYVTLLALTAFQAIGQPIAAQAATFRFESSADPANGQAVAAKSVEGRTMSIAASPAGAVLDFRLGGLGVNSRGIDGATDPEIDKFNLLGGGLAGESESIQFSFDAPGVITTLDFDGVKDESFEFFQLTTPRSGVWSIFDSQIGLRLIDITLIDEPNLTLLTEAGSPDDDLFGIAIPFAAGEVFTLTYREYAPDPSNYQPGFVPEAPNGARFQGLEVTFVPEPSAGLLLASVGGFVAALSRRRLRRNA